MVRSPRGYRKGHIKLGGHWDFQGSLKHDRFLQPLRTQNFKLFLGGGPCCHALSILSFCDFPGLLNSIAPTTHHTLHFWLLDSYGFWVSVSSAGFHFLFTLHKTLPKNSFLRSLSEGGDLGWEVVCIKTQLLRVCPSCVASDSAWEASLQLWDTHTPTLD